MPRYRAIYDAKGKAYEYENDELVWIRDDLSAPQSVEKGPFVLPDTPDFVSPIDGSVVRGRAGIRDHCARHNVTPTRELEGLPPMPLHRPIEVSKKEREATRRTIAEVINSRNYR